MDDENAQENWRNLLIKEQANAIRIRLLSGLLYGEKISADDIDALIFSAYLLGENDQRERSVKRLGIPS